MRYTKMSETTDIRIDLTDAPSVQMRLSERDFTLDPDHAWIHIENGFFDYITFRKHTWHGAGRTFKADGADMPNWVRGLVTSVLADHTASWALAGTTVEEYEIRRYNELTGEALMTVAVVAASEVRAFLKVKRDLYEPRHFHVAFPGQDMVTGDEWLKANRAVKVTS